MKVKTSVKSGPQTGGASGLQIGVNPSAVKWNSVRIPITHKLNFKEVNVMKVKTKAKAGARSYAWG